MWKLEASFNGYLQDISFGGTTETEKFVKKWAMLQGSSQIVFCDLFQ